MGLRFFNGVQFFRGGGGWWGVRIYSGIDIFQGERVVKTVSVGDVLSRELGFFAVGEEAG